MWSADDYTADSTAVIAGDSRIGRGTTVWGLAQIREMAVVGECCVIGRGAYVDVGVVLGDRCKVQNNALLYAPARLGDGCFVGPGVIFTNDSYPRATTTDGQLKRTSDWSAKGVTVEDGASIGAGAIVLGGVRVGAYAVVAAGAVVTSTVAAGALVLGTPARQRGWVGRAGRPLQPDGEHLVCPATSERYEVIDGVLRGPI